MIRSHATEDRFSVKARLVEYGDAVFSFADSLGAAVLMHPQHYELMPAYADKYPHMTLILAHLGSIKHIEAIRNAKHGNIYTDTSGIASSLNSVLEYAVGQIGAEKILFGSDTYSLGFQYGRIAFSSITDADKETILFKNALRLFPQFSRNVE